MNVGDLIKTIRTDYFDQFVETFVSNNDLIFRSFNEAQRQACNRSNLIYDDSTENVVEVYLENGQSTYQLNSKITDIEAILFENKKVTVKSKKELDRKRPLWRTETGMSGKTVSCVIRSHSIRFIPSPDTNDAGSIVYLEAYRLPINALESTSDEPEIPEEYHRDLIYWPLYEAYTKMGENQDLNKAAYFYSQFESVFGKYVSTEQRLNRLEDEKSLFVVPINYSSKLTSDDDWDW